MLEGEEYLEGHLEGSEGVGLYSRMNNAWEILRYQGSN